MVNSPRSDDLFDNSKMSFGGHLEELRICLVRSLLGLGIGFVIALIFADKLVDLVKLPLQEGLKQFYVGRDSTKMEREFDLTAVQKKELQEFMVANQVTVELILMEEQELELIRAGGGGESPSDAPLPEEASDDEGAEPEKQQDAPAKTKQQDAPAKAKQQDAPAKAKQQDAPAKTKQQDAPTISSSSWWRDGTPKLRPVRQWKPLVAKIVTLSGPEAFLIFIKAAIIGGFVISSPWIFVQLWNFVAAGLYPHERKYVYVYMPFSIVLFLSGASMAFFVVFDFVLDFLFTFNESLGLEAEPRISEWMGFVMILPVGFGIAFQLPLVMLLLYRIGIFSIEAYLSKWRLAILVIFVLSMFLTPADPISMMAMAGPLTGLYFLGILLCKFMPRTRNPFGDTGYDPGANPEG